MIGEEVVGRAAGLASQLVVDAGAVQVFGLRPVRVVEQHILAVVSSIHRSRPPAIGLQTSAKETRIPC